MNTMDRTDGIQPPDGRAMRDELNTSWLLVCTLVMMVLCGAMQFQLYRHQHPFFDSLSYYQKLERVMTRTATEGWRGGLAEIVMGHNTVALPFLAAIPVAGWLPPTRLFGVFYQGVGLFLLLLLWDYAIRDALRLSRGWRLLICCGLFALHGWYYPNGGLSDFRMDLSLMVWYGIVSLLFLILVQRLNYRWALALGLGLAGAALNRATAPVYLAVGLVPLGAAICCFSPQRWRLIGLSAVAIVVALLACGWFFILNWDYLRYYYVEWNTDANKKLELWSALGHLKFCFRQWGVSATILVVAAAIIARLEICQQRSARISSELEPIDVDSASHHSRVAWNPPGDLPASPSSYWLWQLSLIWLGLAPLGLLLVLRAGLNPFVVWPASLLLFMSWQFSLASQAHRLNRVAAVILALLVFISVAGAMGRGWHKHATPAKGQMKLHHDLIDQIVEDAVGRNRDRARIATIMATEVNGPSLLSVLTYDRPDALRTGRRIELSGVAVSVESLYFLPAAADWAAVPGATDEAKAETLAEWAKARIDYVLIPTPATMELLKNEPTDIVINQYQALLVEKLLQPTSDNTGWTRVTENIRGGDNHVYHLYRNDAYARYAQMAEGLDLAASQPTSDDQP